MIPDLWPDEYATFLLNVDYSSVTDSVLEHRFLLNPYDDHTCQLHP